MLWFLTFLLVANLVFVYFFNGKKLFSPTIIVNGAFLLSALVLLTNWKFFGYEDISLDCVLIVMLSIYALSFGELLTMYVFQKKRKRALKYDNMLSNNINAEPLKVGKWFWVIVCATAVYIIIGGLSEIYKISLSLGNSKGLLYAVSYVRKYVNAGNPLEISRLITYPAVFVKASALYCMFLFCYNYVNIGSSSVKLLLPGILYCLYTITSTSRTGVIEIFCAFLIMFYAIHTKKNKGVKRSNAKLLQFTVVIGILVALVFIWLGNLRTVAYEENTASDIVNYMGSPLIVFSRWLGRYELSPYPGYATFPQLINILNKIGITDTSISHSEMYSAEDVLASSKSNLKTWLRAPIQDFTIVGMLISRFLIGVIYSCLVQWLIDRNKNAEKHIGKFIFGCLLFYPLVSAAFADKFGGYIQLETVYMVIIFFIIGRVSKKWNKKTGKKVIC